jgi:outer membrane protein OmpA-like peptidoglycan-associated protein
MRKLLVSTTALSVAISPVGTMPGFAQVLNEDGSVTGPDGTVLCMPTADAPCDLDAIIAELKAAEEAAAAEAAAQAEAEAAAAAAADEEAAKAAEEAAAAEAAAQAEAEAEAAKAAEEAAAAEAAAQAEAEAAAAEEEAAKAAEEAAAAEAAAQAEAEAEAAKAAEEAAAAEAAAQAEAEAAEKAAEEAAAGEEPAAEEPTAEEPAAEEPTAEAPVAEEPVAEEPATEEPAAEEPAAEEPAAEAPTAEEPAAEEPVAEEPAAEEPAAEEPVAEEPAAEEPVAEEPAAEDPAAEEPAAEEPAAAEDPVVEEPATEEAATEAPVEGVIDSATGEVIDPAVAAEALAEAEAELAITDDGAIVDPAAGLKVAEPDPALEVEPVEAPVISEGEVESLTDLLTADPTAIDPAAIAAAETISAPAAEDGTVAITETDPSALVAAVTETITEDNVRTSAEEFAAAPRALSEGKKSGLSDLEKAGLLVLGALAVGAIIKNNRAAAADTTVSTKGPQDARVVSNTGDRVIILQPDGTYRVLKDDDTVIRRPGSTVKTETFRDGSTRTIVERADGTQVVTIRDATGRVLRRATYDDRGREIILIDDLVEEEVVVVRDLPKPRKRIVISSKDEDAALKRELAKLEAEKAGRKFSLRQIREIPEVRALAAVIDVEPVTFASGSSAVTADEARNLADLGRVMQELLEENPAEVFLVMGHTDATGKAAMNLALSDRRAESVALALTEYFDIPPENMVVQGYGETELLIDTLENEPQNRRVEVKVITPLMRTAELQ